MTLSELIKALEAAKGPSLQMDGAIWCVANGYEFIEWNTTGCVYRGGSDNRVYRADSTTVRPYTASVDAAIALCERALPGWFIHTMTFETIGVRDNQAVNGWNVEITKGYDGPALGRSGKLPIAICLSILRTKLQETTND
jgi:hypothetical protein